MLPICTFAYFRSTTILYSKNDGVGVKRDDVILDHRLGLLKVLPHYNDKTSSSSSSICLVCDYLIKKRVLPKLKFKQQAISKLLYSTSSDER
ncbi:hypothetical protein DFA_10837 [Cavenderia fasciculata]|uniref:Uncharacterized protein n=1 Tax=Cavenderia fasciculata TaxID=261658 RepID=F4QBJ1_CACFS|nr:uncharacterized protein DFA_10837 [Cavenderia fasciculata]EGG14963.1 hypothetical protein DFA_10837 [Cavenderia fasciculata]|eukprot:XP_004351479.1 hypothetical protein DFA_10837 [Cavenderia fasciculata]